MRKVKLGLIGCGSRGNSILYTVMKAQKFGFLELVAVSDIKESAAKAIGKKYNLPYFTSPEKMLKKDMDFVLICSGDNQHHIQGKLAAEEGKHVLVEKPMAITLPLGFGSWQEYSTAKTLAACLFALQRQKLRP